MVYAAQLHAGQARKGTGVPYISHLLAVTALVLEAGGDEDQAIAALLHDSVEDHGDKTSLEEITWRFGTGVAHIVADCSDSFSLPKTSWRVRKEEYLEHLRTADADTRLVSLADKVHNASSILRDLRQQGAFVWERFKGEKEETLWYYKSLLEVFQAVDSGPLMDELRRVVHEIEELADR